MAAELPAQSLARHASGGPATSENASGKKPSRGHSFGKAWLAVWLLIAAYFGYGAVRGSLEANAARSANIVPPGASARVSSGYRSFTKNIEDVRPGEWALADNPETSIDLSPEEIASLEDDGDPAEWISDTEE